MFVQRPLAFARRQPLQPWAVNLGTLVSGMADLIPSTSGPQIKVASTAEMLVEPGNKVVEAASVEQALGLVNNGLVPEVVVTDHLMPGMSGTELARELGYRRSDLVSSWCQATPSSSA